MRNKVEMIDIVAALEEAKSAGIWVSERGVVASGGASLATLADFPGSAP
jgi:hypothetical protein